MASKDFNPKSITGLNDVDTDSIYINGLPLDYIGLQNSFPAYESNKYLRCNPAGTAVLLSEAVEASIDLTQQNQQRKRFKVSNPKTSPTVLSTPLEIPSSNDTSPSCLLFSRAIPGTGNFITVQRIGNIFQQLGYDSEIFDTEQLTHEQTLELVSSQQVMKNFLY